MEERLSCVEVDPRGPIRATVVWLHGLGADGHDFEPIVPLLGLDDLGVRFVFPHAPRRPVTVNMGLIMRAWYDIRGFELRRDQDERGIRDSAAKIADLLESERARGVPYERIVLAGFSQGGALALHVGLRYPERLAGIVALSSYLLFAEALAEERSAANLGLPVFQGHGTHDPMVPIEYGLQARETLVELGYPVEWREYPMGHEVHPQEIAHIGSWLRARLGSA